MYKLSVAIAANDAAFRQALVELFQETGFLRLEAGGTRETAVRVESSPPEVIAIGVSSPGHVEELELGSRIRRSRSGIPVVLITNLGSEALAVEAMRAGFTDYLKFPADRDELRDAIGRHFGVAAGPRCLGSRAAEPGLIDGELMIGKSAATRETKAYLLKVAQNDSNVLITGETGTGKELAAELIHRNSARRNGPLVCINCAAIPDTLLESELFGFERGAFTGAHASQDGKLKLADRGSVFFDEIGDMSPYAQVKILRVIERHEVQKLGGRRPFPIDIRIIAATNRPIEELSEDRFRKDLFYRLNVARVHLAPLRERRDDIPTLALHFIAEFNQKFRRNIRGLGTQALDFLTLHPWPGNVRELRNLVESAFIDLPQEDVSLLELPTALRRMVQRASNADAVELERIVRALSETNWNKSRAAQRLRWSRMTLYRKMTRYHLSSEPKKPAASLNPIPLDLS